jgi:lipopolysaccharide biosynthesis regulator YciM
MKELLKELENFGLPKDKFAIFGSGPMGIRGLKKVKDLDLAVMPEIWQELAKKYQVKKVKKGEKIFLSKNIEIRRRPNTKLNADKLIMQADVFDGIRYVKLKNVIEYKEKLKRVKDLKDIELIKRYLQKGGK